MKAVYGLLIGLFIVVIIGNAILHGTTKSLIEKLTESIEKLPTKEDIKAVEKRLEEISEKIPKPVEVKPPPKPVKLLTEKEIEEAKMLYFKYCAGCHGTLRKGGTGPGLTKYIGKPELISEAKSIIEKGRRGMPAWKGVISDAEIELLSKFLAVEPPEPPMLTMDEIKKTVYAIPTEKLPKEPIHEYDINNLMVVMLRDIGKVAIVDMESKKIIKTLRVGYAPHTAEPTPDGRFVVVVSRDGWVSKIDLYSLDIVGKVRVSYDARGIAISKYPGFEGKYALIGSYWPPYAVIIDLETMQPLKIINLQGFDVEGKYVKESRAACVSGTKIAPVFIISAKELGEVWLVDYTDLNNLKVIKIKTDKWLHDGFLDFKQRYWMVAANMRNKMVVVDVLKGKFVAFIETGKMPHPGPGAKWIHSKYGPVAATVHIREGKVTIWGIDPENHPEYAWKIIAEIRYAKAGGGLFIRTHPNSPYIFVDAALSRDPDEARTIWAIDKETFEIVKAIKVTDKEGAKALHFEFNKDGTEVWVSVWHPDGELVIYDAKTLEEKARIKKDEYPELITPTGKFAIYNRVHHVG